MNDKKTIVKESIAKLNAERNRLDRLLSDLEVTYVNTAVSTGAVIKQLDELSKTAAMFNKKTQAMNVVYMCCEALRCKHPDAIEGAKESFWRDEQVTAIKNLMLTSFQTLRDE